MNEEQAKALRAPFPDAEIGKLPRIWCSKCKQSPSKACDQHPAAKCRDCGNKHSTAALHLDYVGHAETTDRLLSVDPEWNWEPAALDAAGLPALDRNGGLWIKLTIAGVTRLGYGNAEGKSGGDAIKEIIGDAIRNGSMRFGVALDLWRKTDRVEQAAEHSPQPATRKAAVAQAAVPAAPPPAQPPPAPEPVARSAPTSSERLISDAQLRKLQALFSEKGYRSSDARHDYVKKTLGVDVTNSRQLTTQQASQVIEALNALSGPPPIDDDPWKEYPTT